jgi:hypothetical protein
MSQTENPVSMNATFTASRPLLRSAIDWLKRTITAIALAEEAVLERTDPMLEDLNYLEARLARLEAKVLGASVGAEAR